MPAVVRAMVVGAGVILAFVVLRRLIGIEEVTEETLLERIRHNGA